ncbi:hypothetical protein N7541_009219 [Penicillium brevicompactum]|uniref:Uncharacterized protein n=1 Tax=Penicillium brevicompactum TaxID=5074 RepID=A0A9W9R1W2_PENBR|nr:hypothetical protein N7541_009219 [Penicillium brevicompactum]
MSFSVYTAEYLGAPNHEAIYIETNPTAPRTSEGGRLYHVTGNLLQGMKYDPRGSFDPEFSASYVPGTKKVIGSIAQADLTRFETECCRAVEAPQAQLTLGGQAIVSRYTTLSLWRLIARRAEIGI